jgi:hypothetical protein
MEDSRPRFQYRYPNNTPRIPLSRIARARTIVENGVDVSVAGKCPNPKSNVAPTIVIHMEVEDGFPSFV